MDIDTKIINALADLGKAHQKSEKFIGKEIRFGEKIEPVNFFDMALAYDEEQRLLYTYEKLLAQKYPQHYTTQDVEHIDNKIIELTHS